MGSNYYSAAWTECGCFITCWHEHKTVPEAASCIPRAGGYVVGVENGVMRSLTAEEEREFQRAIPSHSTDNPALEPTPAGPAEAALTDPGYAVMIRIRVGDRWTWTTWMRFETYAEAAAHAREGNKGVRFRSPEWAALRQQTEPAVPMDEAGPAPAVAMSDVDGLKALNKYGYETGNAVLKAKADALREAGLEAYHDKGDEFLCRGNDTKELLAKLEHARTILRDRKIVVERADGSVLSVTGADFSYGVGKDIDEAESRLRSHKTEREGRGEIARGELRGITIQRDQPKDSLLESGTFERLAATSS